MNPRQLRAASPATAGDPKVLPRGQVEVDFTRCRLTGACAEACPTPALALASEPSARRATLTLDLGQCVSCGLCEEACGEGAVRLGPEFELAALRRQDLVTTGHFGREAPVSTALAHAGSEVRRALGRSLFVRLLDAGSCNGCEDEVLGLEASRDCLAAMGALLVDSARQADLLLVSGPVTLPLAYALRAAWAEMPEPRLVAALGACAIGGGIFAGSPEHHGGVASTPGAASGSAPASGFASTAGGATIAVDLFIPGCPPRPEAIAHGIRLLLGRRQQRVREKVWSGPWPGPS